MRRPRSLVVVLAGVAGFAVALLAGLAVAKSFTLSVAKNAPVTNFNTHAMKKENIVVAGGFAVYTLTGNNLKDCTKANMCFHFWPPVTIAAGKMPTAGPGVKGKLGTIKHDGVNQVTLGGHPLYRFLLDTHKRAAVGEGVMSFGGTWHVALADRSSGNGRTGPTATSTPTMPTNPYTYTYSARS
jgi:predicted lipoprotein with Yx(FWY)xxD motif